MVMENDGDIGWAGAWEIPIIDGESLEFLKKMAGKPVLGRGGKPLEWMLVSLRTGEIRYPAPRSG